MAFPKTLWAVGALAMGFIACQPAPPPEQKTEAPPDPAPINALRDQYASMYNSGDVSGLGNLYTDDAVVMNNNQPAANGKEAILAAAQALVGQFTVNISIMPAKTEIVGDLAYEHGTFTMSLTPKAGGGAAMQENGNYLVILKRGPDGAWKLHREIGNSSQPPPPMK
jgi:uncharacterized protein (TIGR02246 family)